MVKIEQWVNCTEINKKYEIYELFRYAQYILRKVKCFIHTAISSIPKVISTCITYTIVPRIARKANRVIACCTNLTIRCFLHYLMMTFYLKNSHKNKSLIEYLNYSIYLMMMTNNILLYKCIYRCLTCHNINLSDLDMRYYLYMSH